MTSHPGREDRHVIPEIPPELAGIGNHETSATCWCQPVVDYEHPLTRDRVYVHRRDCDGPAYEDIDYGGELPL
jgi:hypothetical protein